MTRNVLLTAAMCCLASGVLLPGPASAMLPVGNDDHRRFYRDQEWIWTAPEHPAASVDENAHQALDLTMLTHPAQVDLAFTVPTRHPAQADLAFTVPTRHPAQADLAFTVPTRHPAQADLAFTVPTRHPAQAGMAFTVPTHHLAQGNLAFTVPTHHRGQVDSERLPQLEGTTLRKCA